MWRAFFLLLGFWPGLALAQSALDADAFEALTDGKTFYFSSGGEPYGAEEYLEDRRVRWSFLDGQCLEGRWWQEGSLICFVYEDDPRQHCWTFQMDGGGLRAQFADDSGGRVLYELRQSTKPLHCLGPKVGV
ncbi:hypothetical protein LZG00_06560 [Rhodobacteraceae bacterium LMO-12]|nr:hypothetical protein [Rhodobacteraceae bacterium LMO-JJ12]